MIYYKSKHLQINEDKKGNLYGYHSLFGNFTKFSESQLELLNKIDKGDNIEGYNDEVTFLLEKNFITKEKDINEYDDIITTSPISPDCTASPFLPRSSML